ncbi:hypothetical protein EsH8_IX_000186 [Colletotrichum jinshuiense]
MLCNMLARLAVVGLLTSHAAGRVLASPAAQALGPRSEFFQPAQPWTVHPVKCHDEGDFKGHADISPHDQHEAVESFCKSFQGTRSLTTHHDPAAGNYPVVFKSRFRWKDLYKVNYDFFVQWAEDCRTLSNVQSIAHPLGRGNAVGEDKVTCYNIMRGNFLNCNNGGVGGTTQVGCLLYTFNGGKGGNLLTDAELAYKNLKDEEKNAKMPLGTSG